jgi:hypothetical protein
MKQTAVQWLVDKLNESGIPLMKDELEMINQALEMEKQQKVYSEAIEFAEWIRIKDFQTASKNNWIGLDIKYYTTQELFEQFKNK